MQICVNCVLLPAVILIPHTSFLYCATTVYIILVKQVLYSFYRILYYNNFPCTCKQNLYRKRLVLIFLVYFSLFMIAGGHSSPHCCRRCYLGFRECQLLLIFALCSHLIELMSSLHPQSSSDACACVIPALEVMWVSLLVKILHFRRKVTKERSDKHTFIL